MPYAKQLKLVNKTTTMLDLAKAVEEDKNETLILRIMTQSMYERGKSFVKWERDKEYIDTEREKRFHITPEIRSKMLAEIREEEREKEKNRPILVERS